MNLSHPLTCAIRVSVSICATPSLRKTQHQLFFVPKLLLCRVRPEADINFVTHKKPFRSSIHYFCTQLSEVKETNYLELFNNKMTEKPNVVFVLGGPGAGKGTQCSKIVENYGFVHLSAGDLLREERNKPGSEYGELIEKHIRDGTIVPVEITCSLIDRAMQKNGSRNFLIDGFPRNQNNLDGWNKEMAAKVNVLFVLFFDAPEDVCVQRCLQRGQAGSGRSDDNPESMKKRVATYVNETMPIIEHFKASDLVRKINAAQEPDAVFRDVQTHFDKI